MHRPTLRAYAAELNTKAHALHYHLGRLLPLARQSIEALPPGTARDEAAFVVVMAEAALREHDPTRQGVVDGS